ncbi:MAG: hypothetical protein DKINENOH_01716 [bacterium]|nr:hypothetical protein [bacterium]
MTPVYVITEFDSLAASIERFLLHTRGIAAHRLVFPHHTPSEEWVLRAFRQIADTIERSSLNEAGPQALRKAIAIIDLADANLQSLEDLNPIANNLGWAAVVAMLVLAFPEVHWVFITPYQSTNSSLFARAHIFSAANSLMEILALYDRKFTNLFDATNLRNCIRQRIHQESDSEGNPIASYLPLRKELAAAIDEEETYAYFNAYTAYRYGFCSHVVASYAIMQSLFDSSPQTHHETVSITVEDIYLNFADQDVALHLSNLQERDHQFTELNKPRYRIFVTAGHGQDRQIAKQNREYLQRLNARGKHTRLLYKPLSGIFDLWEKSGLKQRLRRDGGLAPEFNWPPTGKPTGAQELRGHHSAPGRLLEIADRLIQRAERILHSAMSVPEAVHGALLALEAQELLGNKTPTTALEALALKHQLEVTAECMFYGVEYNFDVESRFKDIRQEVRSIGRWFNPKTRRLSELNAEIGILSDLVRIFRQYNQFDEERECLAKIRDLYRHHWFRRDKVWAWLFYPFVWYVEYLLGRLRRFFVAIASWLLVLSFLFFTFCNCNPAHLTFLGGLSHAFTSFFGLQPPHELNGNANAVLVVMFAILLGFVHLGIFVSHLYYILARR